MAGEMPGWAAQPFLATPDALFANGSRGSPGSITTTSITVTATGGSGAYSYLWTRQGAAGDVPMTCDSPTSATTTWTATNLSTGLTSSEAWICTVTDSALSTAVATINVTMEWTF